VFPTTFILTIIQEYTNYDISISSTPGKGGATNKEQAEMEDKEAKQRAKKDAEEAKKAKKTEPPAQDKAKEPGSEMYNGLVRLTIMPPVDSGQLSNLEEHLCQVQDLRLVLIGGSVTDGTEIVVSTENPIPLLDILREMPPVAQVAKKGKTTQITLKSA
jgi:hypothetical protein